MPNRASLSIAGLYSWDAHIFDLMQTPAGVNRQTIIDNILLECSELTVIYPDWNFMQKAIGSWSAKELEIWNKIYALEHMDYNPIENYDRYEDEVENIGNKGKTVNIGSNLSYGSSVDNSDTVNRVAGFNSNDLANQSQSEGTTLNSNKDGGQSSGMSMADTEQSRSRGSRIHGNIGVTTTQQMMEQELNILPKVHIDDYIVNSFKERFCIMVY